jgi:hypothetical protein
MEHLILILNRCLRQLQLQHPLLALALTRSLGQLQRQLRLMTSLFFSLLPWIGCGYRKRPSRVVNELSKLW